MARLGFMLRSAWLPTQACLSHLLLYTNPALMDSHVKARELNRVGQGSREIRKGKAVSSLPVIQASPRSLLQQLRMSTVIMRPLPSAPGVQPASLQSASPSGPSWILLFQRGAISVSSLGPEPPFILAAPVPGPWRSPLVHS